MKPGDKKEFFYVPMLGFIEAAETMEETMKRMHRASAKKENEDENTLQLLQKENPGKCIIRVGDTWLISEAPLD